MTSDRRQRQRRQRRRQGEDRRHPSRHGVLRALGDRRPTGPRGRVRGGRCRLRHPERAERRRQDGPDRRLDDRQRRDRAGHRQPRQRLGCGHPGEGQGAGRRVDRLRPPHPRWLRGVLRLLRQREGRPAPGRGPPDLPGPGHEGEHRLPQRFAGRLQRHLVLQGCALRARREHQLHQGRRAGCSQVGQQAGWRDLRADVDPAEGQDRRRPRGQRRSRRRGDRDPGQERSWPARSR